MHTLMSGGPIGYWFDKGWICMYVFKYVCMNLYVLYVFTVYMYYVNI